MSIPVPGDRRHADRNGAIRRPDRRLIKGDRQAPERPPDRLATCQRARRPDAGIRGRRRMRAAPSLFMRHWWSVMNVLVGVLMLASMNASARPFLRPASEIVEILAQGPHAGDCERCHTMHAEGSTPQPMALLGPDDNTLCDGCHATPWAGGSYPGLIASSSSPHGSNPSMIWPGPEPPLRTETGAAGKCVNCHEPHGRADALGNIPLLTNLREEALCLTCHDGNPVGPSIDADLRKGWRHPIADYSGRHAGPLENSPADFGASPVNKRHAECPDCHNPHLARGGPDFPAPGEAANSLVGVSRLQVLNGLAGTPPMFTFRAGSDTTTRPVLEYQVCFKCHSSWTVQPTGQTDLALALNTNNPSYHPVEGSGRNPGIRAAAFVNGWNDASIVRCGDCHGSNGGGAAGPHGSTNRYLLKAPYTASSSSRTMSFTESCFQCHAWDVYANASSSETTRSQSRFNKPGADKGHAEHVGEERYPCYACHTTHGSAVQSFLLVTGRSPGIRTYTKSANGGTCSPTCHGSESYTVNYPR